MKVSKYIGTRRFTTDEYNKKNRLAAALGEARAVILYEQCGSAYKFQDTKLQLRDNLFCFLTTDKLKKREKISSVTNGKCILYNLTSHTSDTDM
jgi:hypothetical protein